MQAVTGIRPAMSKPRPQISRPRPRPDILALPRPNDFHQCTQACWINLSTFTIM